MPPVLATAMLEWCLYVPLARDQLSGINQAQMLFFYMQSGGTGNTPCFNSPFYVPPTWNQSETTGIDYTLMVLITYHWYGNQSGNTNKDHAWMLLLMCPWHESQSRSIGNDQARMVHFSCHWYKCHSGGTHISCDSNFIWHNRCLQTWFIALHWRVLLNGSFCCTGIGHDYVSLSLPGLLQSFT